MPHCMNAIVKTKNVTEVKMLVNLNNESFEGASTAKSQQMQPILFAAVMPLDCQGRSAHPWLPLTEPPGPGPLGPSPKDLDISTNSKDLLDGGT
jgi:hypothetical protein